MNENPDDLSARLRASLPAQQHELPLDVVTGAATRTAPHLTHPARRVAVAGGTLVVASLAVAALVVSLPLQQAPLFTASGSSASPMAASEDAATSDMRIAPWVNYEYVPGDGLSTSGGSGHVYQLKRVGSAEQRAQDVAAAFGLSGTAAKSQYFDPAYPTWVVGSEDGSVPTVAVTWSGTGNWWYNDPTAQPQAVCEQVAPDSGEATDEQYDCVSAEVTAETSLVPNETDARAKAHDLFALTGFDVPAKDIHVTVDPWQTTATANLVVDGVATAIDFGVGWAPTGKIAYAYGHSIGVSDRGSYGTVSAHDVVGRIADGRWFGAGGPDYQGGAMIYAADSLRSSGAGVASSDPDVATEGPTEPAEPTDTGTDPATEPTPVPDPSTDPSTEPGVEPGEEPSAAPSEEPTAEPEPTLEPIPEPERVVVTVENAGATLLLMWDSEGNAWLVPGFAMKTPEGWWNTIVSLVEGVIELPAPVAIDPYMLNPALQ